MVRPGAVVEVEVWARRRLRKASRQGTSVGPARKMVVEWVGFSLGGELGVNICIFGVSRDISGIFTGCSGGERRMEDVYLSYGISLFSLFLSQGSNSLLYVLLLLLYWGSSVETQPHQASCTCIHHACCT